MLDLSFFQDRDLLVYSSTTCPDCHRLGALLTARGVSFTKIDILEDPSAGDRLEAATGKRGVPTIQVNGDQWVRGYHVEQPGRLREILLWDELRSAIEASTAQTATRV